MISAELQNQIAVWRQKSNDGTLSLDDMREAVKALRGGRIAAAATAKSRPTKPTPRAVEDMLGELKGL